jgi:hypothetical protein
MRRMFLVFAGVDALRYLIRLEKMRLIRRETFPPYNCAFHAKFFLVLLNG